MMKLNALDEQHQPEKRRTQREDSLNQEAGQCAVSRRPSSRCDFFPSLSFLLLCLVAACSNSVLPEPAPFHYIIIIACVQRIIMGKI